jgi:hypothetical protein
MMTGTEIRAKRNAAGIAGHIVCKSARIPRSRLSDIEREYVNATPGEMQRISAAIDQIIETKQHLTKLADEAGLSLAGVRL